MALMQGPVSPHHLAGSQCLPQNMTLGQSSPQFCATYNREVEGVLVEVVAQCGASPHKHGMVLGRTAEIGLVVESDSARRKS